jgi:hypothetical protein
VSANFAVAIAEVNGFPLGRTEGNFGLNATFGTGGGEHFAIAAGATRSSSAVSFTESATRGTTAGLIGVTLLSVEFLLANGESELSTAIAAGKDFVLHRWKTSRNRKPITECFVLVADLNRTGLTLITSIDLLEIPVYKNWCHTNGS